MPEHTFELVRRLDGSWVETRPQACPRCAAPWRIGPCARFQVGSVIAGGYTHRTWLCLDCGHEESDPPLPKSSAPRLMAPDGGLTEG